MTLALALLAVPAVTYVAPGAAQVQPPATPVRPVEDTLHGTLVTDPYRWLETESDEVRRWFLAQGAHARATLDALPGRNRILDRIRAIAAVAPPDVSLPREAGGRWFYTKRKAGEIVAKGYVLDAWTREEWLLVDPLMLGGGAEGASTLATFRPSPDGRLILYGVTSGGSEDVVLRVRDAATGRGIAGPVERVRSYSPFDPWSPDGRSFFYIQRRDRSAGARPDEFFRGVRVVRHRLGEDVAADVPVFSAAVVGEDEGLFPLLDIDARSGLALGMLATGVEQHTAFYIASADQLAAGTPERRPLFALADSVISVAVRGSDLYVRPARHTLSRGAPADRLERPPRPTVAERQDGRRASGGDDQRATRPPPRRRGRGPFTNRRDDRAIPRGDSGLDRVHDGGDRNAGISAAVILKREDS